MSPGTLRHLCRPSSTESTNPSEAAPLFKLFTPVARTMDCGWGHVECIQKKSFARQLYSCTFLDCEAVSSLPPSCDRLGRFGLASSLLDRLARSGGPCAHHTVYCPGLLRIPIPAHRRTERPTGPDRQCPPLSQPGSFCLLQGRVQPTGECQVKMGGWLRVMNCVDTHM